MTRAPLTVVCWKWKPAHGYRSSFTAEHVHVLQRMVARHYSLPHRFVCVTDDADGIDRSSVDVVPLWDTFADVPSPHGKQYPSCYRRLRAFAPEAVQFFGPRFVSLDLDMVIVGDVTALWSRHETFVAWADTEHRRRYNGSMWMLTCGARPSVWDRFDPAVSPREARNAGCPGSDQGWISHVLGTGEATWTARDGVYSYRNEIADNGNALPINARVIAFHGSVKPWSQQAQQCDWVREHYR